MQRARACEVRVVSPKDKIPDGAVVVNTTSRSKEAWSKGLSPFFLGPVELYGNFVARNMENAWQYAKVYREHVDDTTGEPTEAYFTWATQGWSNPKPVRFPNGRGAIPEYSYWDGKRYGYISARKKIYAPLYAKLVVETPAFQQIKRLYETQEKIYLVDFDGYDYIGMGRTMRQVLNDERKKMGHAFVLAMLLSGERLWEEGDIPELDYVLPRNRPASSKPRPSSSSSSKTSAGLLIRSSGKYLLCHATPWDRHAFDRANARLASASQGAQGENRPHEDPSLRGVKYGADGNWTISKGLVDGDETPMQAAIRELKEETGIDLLGEPAYAPLLEALHLPGQRSESKAKEKKEEEEENDEKRALEPISTYTVGKGKTKKTVLVYLLDDPEGRIISHNGKEQMRCSSLIDNEYVPIHLQGAPEMDDFSWVTREEAHEMVFPSQRHLFGDGGVADLLESGSLAAPH